MIIVNRAIEYLREGIGGVLLEASPVGTPLLRPTSQLARLTHSSATTAILQAHGEVEIEVNQRELDLIM